MEALAAISLTGNILQFTQFISSLVTTAGELYQTPDGFSSSDATADIETTHRRLLNFSALLQQNQIATPQQSAIGVNDANALANDLAKECKGICDELLEMTGKLRLKEKGSRRLNSYVAAFKMIWNRERIEGIWKRLNRFQDIVSMHFLPVIRQVERAFFGKSDCANYRDGCLVHNNRVFWIRSKLSDKKAIV